MTTDKRNKREAFVSGVEVTVHEMPPEDEGAECIFTIDLDRGDKVTGVISASTGDYDLMSIRWETGGNPKSRMRVRCEATGEKIVFDGNGPDNWQRATLDVCAKFGYSVGVSLVGNKANRWFRSMVKAASEVAA
ncbi:hypothetical protein ETAA8_45660 [Anatilimnocola aggregata]|uniref:Uncharacterized protein n=1 Tax=Anatilimnocola aggregata TaxID=2528021 RepID=A0A517YGU7_9BACT|nr:hypothetical protein ETAA8_45660 [Anatilimnocola aggregata]